MSALSNVIEKFIINLIEQTESGTIEIGRNDLAEKFNCAPSQINYVLNTRFTPYKGYYIESKRGGGGYIKIVRVCMKSINGLDELILNTVGDSISKNKAFDLLKSLTENDLLRDDYAELIRVAISDRSLEKIDREQRDEVRANILINILLILNI